MAAQFHLDHRKFTLLVSEKRELVSFFENITILHSSHPNTFTFSLILKRKKKVFKIVRQIQVDTQHNNKI